jgi:hypothetical protein
MAGAILAGLLLTTYIPPLSAIPNPVGLFWRFAGGYSYDPNLPFRNSFVINGSPDRLLAPRLAVLLGAVGLSPLDPVQPLRAYEFLRVGLHPDHPEVALVTTRFIYADGTSRVYPVPLAEPEYSPAGFWRTGWDLDGLERLRSQHLALRGQPFANESSPIRLGPARRLDTLPPAAQRLDEVNPYHWLWGSVRVQHLVWSPGGQHFLVLMETSTTRQLWAVSPDGAAPYLVAEGDIFDYGWSPDGSHVLFTRFDPAAAAHDPALRYAIVSVPFDTSRTAREVQLVTGLESDVLPGLTETGAWFFSADSAWGVPYSGGAPTLLFGGLDGLSPSGAPLPSPDGLTAAFACGRSLCLLPDLPAQLGSSAPRVIRTEIAPVSELAWAPGGDQLAVVTRDPNSLLPVDLVVVNQAGQMLFAVTISPRDATETPQWTPDGQAVLVQTYPQDGRRIIAVDIPSRQVLDLSQEHWDAYFALSPDGQRLLLNNGRGDFWEADLIR